MIPPAGASLGLGFDAGSPSSNASPERPFAAVLSALSKTGEQGAARSGVAERGPSDGGGTALQAETAGFEDSAGETSLAYGFDQLGMFGLTSATSDESGPQAARSASASAGAPPLEAPPGLLQDDGTPALPSFSPRAGIEEGTAAVAAEASALEPEALPRPNLAAPALPSPVSEVATGPGGSPTGSETQDPAVTEPASEPVRLVELAEPKTGGEVSVLILPGADGMQIVTASGRLPEPAKARLAAAIARLRAEFGLSVQTASHNGEVLDPSLDPAPGVALS